MEYAKKMILVDPRMLDSLQKTPPVPEATSKSLSEIDQAMRDVLDRDDMDDNNKADSYQQLLWRFLKRFGQYRDKPLGKVEISQTSPTSVTSPDEETIVQKTSKVEKRVLESVPKTMKRKAQLLLDHMKDNTDASWNEKGELVYQGQTMEGTNMSDLVNDALRQRKKTEDPRGWQTFAEALKASNVPRELIGHPERWKWMHQKKSGEERGRTRKRTKRITSPSPMGRGRGSHQRPRRQSQSPSGRMATWISL